MSTKPLLVEVVAHRARHLVTQAQALLHHVATQVEIAVLEPQLFVRRLRRDGTAASRRGSGSPARAPAARPGPTARLALAVPAGRARTRPLMRMQNSPRSRSASANTSLRVRIEHDLQQPFAVAQVDEDHPAVVAPAMHPAGHADFLADEGLVDLAAIMGTHWEKGSGAERGMLRTPPRPCKEMGTSSLTAPRTP